jgi:hypothetical protein
MTTPPAAIAAGAVLLMWPALMNFYPLLFSDTGAFLAQALEPFMIWDKPWIYGPALAVFSARLTLWLPALAQAGMLSWLLWRLQAVFFPARPRYHFALCAVLAVGSAAPWVASSLMPDILAPVTVLCLFLIGFAPTRLRGWQIIGLTTFAIAAHLAHLVIAAACIALFLVLRPRVVPRAAAPLAGALALLMITNLVGHGRLSVSPYGAVFALARLTADGPARDYLQEACPAAGYHLCAWVDRLPADSDAFIWDPDGPAWSIAGGAPALAPEAARIVVATIETRPLAVVRVALANTWAQLTRVRLGDTLGNYWLDETVGLRLRTYFPASEESRFHAARQFRDRLTEIAMPLNVPHAALLMLGALGTVVVAIGCRRHAPRLAALAVVTLVGVLGNAFATGALSGPHDRYQARIAWLLLLAPALYIMRRISSDGARTSAS